MKGHTYIVCEVSQTSLFKEYTAYDVCVVPNMLLASEDIKQKQNERTMFVKRFIIIGHSVCVKLEYQ